MAIVIEEEKNRSGMVHLLGWAAIIVVLGVAAYYIFLAQPEIMVVTPTGALSTIGPITQINLDANQVIGSASFQALQNTIPAPSSTGPAGVGRLNPFVAP